MFTFENSVEELLPEVAEETNTHSEKLYNLVVYNDDVNTFDFVINCLITICKHHEEQAEQCTFLVHHKGKCVVKSGPYKLLEKFCSALLDKGLTAKIE